MKKISAMVGSIILTSLFSIAYADSSNHYATEQNTLAQIYNNVGNSANNNTPPVYAEGGVAMVEGHFDGAFAAKNNAEATTALPLPPAAIPAPKSTTSASLPSTAATPTTTPSVATGFGN